MTAHADPSEWPMLLGTEADCRADLRTARPEWRTSDRVLWLRRHRLEQDNRCHYCCCWLTSMGEDPLLRATLDHVVAKSLGGEHSFENTVAACWLCNTAKQSMPVEDAALLLPHGRVALLNTMLSRKKSLKKKRNLANRRQRAQEAAEASAMWLIG